MIRTIIIRTRFVALHYWPGCDIPEVEFLKHPHRHEFHVEVEIQVGHTDRQKEFFVCKKELNNFVKKWEQCALCAMSCEMFAEDILTYLTTMIGDVISVSVAKPFSLPTSFKISIPSSSSP